MTPLFYTLLFVGAPFLLGFIAGYYFGWRDGYDMGTEHGEQLAKKARDLSDSAQQLYNEALTTMQRLNPEEWGD